MDIDASQLRFWRRIEGGMYRLGDTMCRMRCVFCPTSLLRRDETALPGVAPHRTELVLAELDQILSGTPAEQPIRLTANDLMVFEGFFGILAAFHRHGRRLEFDTPGLRLADPELARAVSRYDVHVTVSCQAASRRSGYRSSPMCRAVLASFCTLRAKSRFTCASGSAGSRRNASWNWRIAGSSWSLAISATP